MDDLTLTLAAVANAVVDAKDRLIAEYRARLLEAREHAMVLARHLSESRERQAFLEFELEQTRRELARKDERIAELERDAWRERMGDL